MDAALDKVAAAVDASDDKVEAAVRSALGEKAGDAVHAASESVKSALKDNSKREQIKEIAGKAQAKVQELVGEAKK